MKKLNVGRFILATLAVAAGGFVMGGIIHGKILHEFYQNPLWRAETVALPVGTARQRPVQDAGEFGPQLR